MKKIITTLIFVLTFSLSQSQTLPSFDIVGGVGLAELVHLGIKTQVAPQSQIGLFYGNGLYYKSDEHYRTYSMDYQWHWGRMSKYDRRKVYYLHSGVIYWSSDNIYQSMKSWSLNLGLGREFHLSNNVGLCLDFSLITALHQDRTIKDVHYEPFLDITLSDAILLPTSRLQFFYSF